MNKKLLIILSLFLGLSAYGQGFDVNNYYVDVKINADGYFDVTEDYDITFTSSKRGIYRDFLLRYDLVNEDGSKEKRQIELSDIAVADHKWEVTSKIGRRITGEARIKIGDPDVYLIGDVDYNIRYRVKNAFLHSDETVQFYWNLKPSDWNTTFADMQFSVQLPAGVNVSEENVFVYGGYVGDDSLSNDFDIDITDGVIRGVAKPDFVSYYGQAVTILVKMPPGAVMEIKPFWPFWTKYGWTLIIAGFIGVFYRLWRKYGKDDKVPMAISYFPPNNIDPAMAGFLIDDKQDTRDLISFLPHWGRNGYIRMEEIDGKGWFGKDDTEIFKLKPLPSNVPPYERELFFDLFGAGDRVKVSSLKNSFYTTMNTCKSLLKDEAQQYYEPASKKVQSRVTLWGILLTIFTAPLLLFFWGVIAAVALVIVNIVLLILNFYMIKKNSEGNQIFAELKGFRQFIKTAEENKLKMLLKESPNYFESTMAYALAFGSLSSWAKKFDGLDVQPPQWYHSHTGAHMSMHSFSNSFNKTMAATSSTMVSTPSSSGSGSSGSGGGFSGGGFGGGGGGSW